MTIVQIIKKIKIFCDYCHAAKFVTDQITGETICSSCGFVISENAEDRGMERRLISNTSDTARTGPGLSLKMHDKGLNTRIGAENRDSVGKPLSAKTTQMFWPITKMGQQITDKKLCRKES